MYDHVYAFGHQDKTAAADFVTLALKGSAHVIQLTGRHFIPVAAGMMAAACGVLCTSQLAQV